MTAASRLDIARPPVLVTGGAGYIGSNVALALLDTGRRVVVLDDLSTGSPLLVPSDAMFVEGSAGDSGLVQRLVQRFGIRTVMHFAASISVPDSVADPAGYYRNNFSETVTLAAACAAGGVTSFILSSTAAVYGEGDGRPLRESDPVAPINPYGRSKAMAEMALADMVAAGGMGVGVLRYFNVAGADPLLRSGQASRHPHHLIELAVQVVAGRRERLSVFGTDYPTRDGTAVRDYVHVRDIADAHLLLARAVARNGGFQLYNVGTGEGATVMEVIRALEQVACQEIPLVNAARRPGDPAVLTADSRRIQQELGWAPRHSSLQDILRHALMWDRARTVLPVADLEVPQL